MKRATLTTYPTTPAAPPADVTDRLLASQPAAPAAQRPSKPAAARRPHRQAATPAPSEIENALAAVATATEALQQAGRAAPARYDVALRYRLDALAHHLQQVKDFVTSVTTR